MRTPVFILALCTLFACSNNKNDSVERAQVENLNSAIDEDISVFLTEAADARMMGIEQGKLAREKSSTETIRSYGERMISDQTKLLHEIRVLAASKNIVLPNTLSNDKADGLEDLQEEEGDAFDKKFIKMMRRDHKRDVGAFEKATDFRDRDVQQFATNYLPVVEFHLDRIEEIRENYEASAISERNASGEQD